MQRFATDGTELEPYYVVTGESPSFAMNGIASSAVGDVGFAWWVWNTSQASPLAPVRARFMCADDSVDADGDGTSDRCDPCNRSQASEATEKVAIAMSQIGTDPELEDDRIRLAIEFDLPAGTSFTDVDPTVHPVRVVVDGADGAGRIDVDLPTLALSSGQTEGWTRRPLRTQVELPGIDCVPCVNGNSQSDARRFGHGISGSRTPQTHGPRRSLRRCGGRAPVQSDRRCRSARQRRLRREGIRPVGLRLP